MVVKIVALFLVFIAVLAMFGRLRVPGSKRLAELKRNRLGGRKCPSCGRHRIGKDPCPCGRGKS